jgi:ERCC4-type nuclease
VQACVIVDRRERESRLLDALRRLDVAYEIAELPIADYRVGLALVERKSVKDLHLSIIRGRFWPQIGRLSRTAKRPHLLVEGEDLDRGALPPASVRGALLAVGELGISVIRSSDPEDSALWLKTLGDRSQRVRTTRTYARRTSDAAETMLAAVPGISTVTARALLSRFGSIAAIVDAGPDQWLSISGVGPKRAQALWETLARTHLQS